MRPETTLEQAAQLVADVWGCTPTHVTQLAGYDDLNFLLTVTSMAGNGGAERSVLLKVSNSDAGAMPGFLEAQNEVMLYLHGRGLPVNVPIRGKAGYVATVAGAGCTHAARLLSYLPGELLLHTRRDPALFTRLGAFLARVDQELAAFQHEALRREHTWSPAALPASFEAARPQLGGLPPDKLELLEGVVALFTARLAGAGELRTQMIHTDCNEQNVLVGPGGQIAGLIDWGDCCESALVAEVAIAMAYAALLEEEDPFAAAGPLLRGYESVLPLTPPERGLLRTLCMGRLAQSLSLGYVAAEQHPENREYLLGTQRRGWDVLRLLWGLSDEEFLARCDGRTACLND